MVKIVSQKKHLSRQVEFVTLCAPGAGHGAGAYILVHRCASTKLQTRYPGTGVSVFEGFSVITLLKMVPAGNSTQSVIKKQLLKVKIEKFTVHLVDLRSAAGQLHVISGSAQKFVWGSMVGF
jgi:hypothetical protein